MGFLNDLDLDKDAFDAAKDSTVTEAFEVLKSGAYDATVESIVLYKNQFDGTSLRVNIKIAENDRVLTYRQDISKTKADNTVNEGFLSRLKSICSATNFDVDKFKTGEAVKINSFGKECNGQYLLGVNGKSVTALVRHSVDTTKAEGESYRDSNDIEGITHKGAEDITLFADKIAKNDGLFNYKGYVKGGTKKSTPATSSEKEEIKALDF